MHGAVVPAQAGTSPFVAEHAPQGDPGLCRGDDDAGVLMGIARHARRGGAMETVKEAAVTLEGGIAGDFRGGAKGKPYRRQVTLMEQADWDTALAELGVTIPWQERRANLLIDKLDLPQEKGVRLRIGVHVVLEITRETDPCNQMDALVPGLFAALKPDWRGGACAMVITGGMIAIGDAIRIER